MKTIISVYFNSLKENAERKAKKEAEKNFRKFSQECWKYGIQDLKNPGSAQNSQRLDLIAKKYGYSLTDPEVLRQFNDLCEEKIKKDEQAIEDAKRKEKENCAKLAHYAQFHGNDKPVAMFKDLAEPNTGSSAAGYIPLKKESDGMIMAGIASGIGGTVPALVSLSNTAKNNETIRQQNQMAKSINNMLLAGELKAIARARHYREEADKLAVKLIGDMPSEEVFQHLQFDNIKTAVSQFGTVTVKAKASIKDEVKVFDKPGFIDGYVIAEIYDGTGKIGEAIVIFPAYGSIYFEMMDYGIRRHLSGPVELEGMCLNCGEQGKEYTVKFRPGDLWIMEK